MAGRREGGREERFVIQGVEGDMYVRHGEGEERVRWGEWSEEAGRR